MTRRRLLAAAATALVAAAIAPPAAQALDVVARASDSGRHLTLHRHDVLRVSLEENPSTGYAWRITRRPPRSILRLRSDQFFAPPATDPPAVGAPGRRVVVWRAVGRGRTRLALKLYPPGGGKAAKAFRLSVTVR